MDFGEIAKLGTVGLSLLAILMLIDFIRKRLGNGKGVPILECPNKIHGLEVTLRGLDKQIGRLVDHHEEYPPATVSDAMKRVARVEIGVNRLLEETQPGSRAQMVREESRDLLSKLVTLVEKNGRSRG